MVSGSLIKTISSTAEYLSRVSPEFLKLANRRMPLVTVPLRNAIFGKNVAYGKDCLHVFIYILPQSTEIFKTAYRDANLIVR